MKMGEKISPGNRTMFEFFVMEEIMKYFGSMSIEQNADSILTIYSVVQEVVKGLELKYSLRPKVKQDIETFVKEHKHIVSEFKCITLMQLSNSVDKP